MPTFQLRRALLPDGWTSDVRLDVDESGVISAVRVGGIDGPGAWAARDTDTAGDTDPGSAGRPIVLTGAVVPGMPDLHSHGFQRAMAGLTERRAEGRDTFWSWREVMYGFVDHLAPEDVEAITTLAQVEMLEAGFTAVAEFHYLHHQPDGTPYDDPAETSARICAAAARSGISLTLLPVLYRHGGFGRRAPDPGQRRFVSDLELYARVVDGARRSVASLPGARLGLAPHSLRAVTTAEISEVRPLVEGGPYHIHVAEQVGEVDAALAALGTRPVAHLLDTQPVDDRWCLVHATHMDAEELARAAATGAIAGLCPVTEANLGDGLFEAEAWRAGHGRFGIGTDSNVRIDLADELRTLEYGRRLTDRARNVLADPGASTGRTLFDGAIAGGTRAVGRNRGGIEPGAAADLVVLDTDHPVLYGREDDALLDAWIFGGGPGVVRDVWCRGRRVVRDGRAAARDEAERAWRRTVGRLAGAGAP